jgi:hypothetical protein
VKWIFLHIESMEWNSESVLDSAPWDTIQPVRPAKPTPTFDFPDAFNPSYRVILMNKDLRTRITPSRIQDFDCELCFEAGFG